MCEAIVMEQELACAGITGMHLMLIHWVANWKVFHKIATNPSEVATSYKMSHLSVNFFSCLIFQPLRLQLEKDITN